MTRPQHPDWMRLHLWQIQPVRDALVIALVLGLLWLGYKLSLVTVPLLIAMALAYMFEPLVGALTRRRMVSRPGVAIGIIVLVLTIIVAPVAIGIGYAGVQGVRAGEHLAVNVDRLVKSLDKPEDGALREKMPPGTWLRIRDYLAQQEKLHQRSVDPAQPLAQEPSDTYRMIRMGVDWARENAAAIGKKAVESGAGAVTVAVSTFSSIGRIVFGAFLTAFFFFFLCTGYGRVLTFWQRLIPARKKSRVIELLAQMDRVIAGFIRGRVTICAFQMIYYTLAYWAIGVPAPLLVGPIVGALCLLPYVPFLGVPVAILLMALEPSGVAWQTHWAWVLFAPVGVWLIAQFTDDYVLTPRIQGKTTGMDTPTILFASLAGGALAGVYGLLIAIPVAACIKILLKEVFWPRFKDWSEGRARDFLPIEGE